MLDFHPLLLLVMQIAADARKEVNVLDNATGEPCSMLNESTFGDVCTVGSMTDAWKYTANVAFVNEWSQIVLTKPLWSHLAQAQSVWMPSSILRLWPFLATRN